MSHQSLLPPCDSPAEGSVQHACPFAWQGRPLLFNVLGPGRPARVAKDGGRQTVPSAPAASPLATESQASGHGRRRAQANLVRCALRGLEASGHRRSRGLHRTAQNLAGHDGGGLRAALLSAALTLAQVSRSDKWGERLASPQLRRYRLADLPVVAAAWFPLPSRARDSDTGYGLSSVGSHNG